jgi:hypothetical protein
MGRVQTPNPKPQTLNQRIVNEFRFLDWESALRMREGKNPLLDFSIFRQSIETFFREMMNAHISVLPLPPMQGRGWQATIAMEVWHQCSEERGKSTGGRANESGAGF